MWLLGITSVVWDPGVAKYILSSWLPNVALAAVFEVVQKVLIEFNPSPTACKVMRWLLYWPWCYGCFFAIVPGRWLTERELVAAMVREAAQEKGDRWGEAVLPDDF